MIEVAIVSIMFRTIAPGVDADLRERYATDIAAVADTVEEAAALSVTQLAESDLDPLVESCRRTGDNGASISEFQLKSHWWGGFSRSDICASNALAVTLALKALRVLRQKGGSWHSAFRRYVGVSVESDPRLRNRGRNFDRLIANLRRES